MLQQYQFPVAAVGTTQLINENNLIRSITIDNSSGMWLYVREVGKYVPPNVTGWVQTLTPFSNTVHIDYVNALNAGVASTVTGGPIIVSTYDVVLPDNEGNNYTVATIADINALETRLDALIANTNGILTDSNSQLNVIGFVANGNHCAPLAVPPWTKNTYIRWFNNSASNILWVGTTDVNQVAAGTPIYPAADFSAGFIAGGTASIYACADTGLTVDVRVFVGTFS